MRGLWTHLERLGGGVGTRGPGETQIETDRRLARDRIAALRRRLRDVHASRQVMRGERERSALPQIALAGYTNAGKSTLLNALTGAERRGRRPPLPDARPDDARARDRRAHLPAQRHRRLHPQAAPPARRRVRRDARGDAPRRADPARRRRERRRGGARGDDARRRGRARGDRRRRAAARCSCSTRPTCSTSSGARAPSTATATRCWSRRPTGDGLDALRAADRRAIFVSRRVEPVELLLPYAEGARLAELHELAGELEREDTPEGVRVRALLRACRAPRASRASPTGPARR